jgi:integrase
MASITKRGDSYRALVRKKGFPPVSESFKRKVDAERWARDTEAAMDRRLYVVDDGQLVRAVFQRYRDEVSATKLGARWEKLRINNLARTAKWMRLTVSQISYRDLQAWRDERVKEVSAASVLREFNLISSVFNHARNEWHVSMHENPCSRVRRPAKPKARTRRVSASELAFLTQHLQVGLSLKLYAAVMFLFAIETGMRMGEMARLRWEDVHMDERWAYVLPSKNGDDRVIPLSDRALELLLMLWGKRNHTLVFPVNAGALGTTFREMCKKEGIVDLHFHDSRHEACSRLSKVYTVMELAKIIGHRDLKSLMVYYNPTAAELVQKLRGVAQPTPQHPQLPTPACGTAEPASEGVSQGSEKRIASPC